jgi:Mn2+/Fe2+ NRAMP family transporter
MTSLSQKIASAFSITFTVLNYLIYLFLLVVLIGATYDKSLLTKFNFEWWVCFMVLQIWFNVVITRKSEINQD